jgi:ectoine hydroxylase
MTPEQVLGIPPRLLTQKQREFYFENGYLLLEKLLSNDWIVRLRQATEEMVENSRSITRSDATWDLDKGHTAAHPRLRRLSSMNDHHPALWDYASSAASPLPDVIADLVGPDVKFHHSKLNFKWSKGGDEVKWHQDISFWPHTNYTPCTAGTYIFDCSGEQGPLGVLRGSHKGPVVDQYNDKGEWVGCLKPEDAAAIDMSKVDYLEGPAGSVTIHNCRTLHYSKANWSDNPRPLLLNTFSAANAMPYTHNPLQSKYMGAIVRGQPARWAYHDPRPCLLPPDWSGGYTSIFALQQGEGLAPHRPASVGDGNM